MSVLLVYSFIRLWQVFSAALEVQRFENSVLSKIPYVNYSQRKREMSSHLRLKSELAVHNLHQHSHNHSAQKTSAGTSQQTKQHQTLTHPLQLVLIPDFGFFRSVSCLLFRIKQ
ncbi:hypothetical protein MJT46_014791 [Ovis ammon polii x Ovis aries]|nr:hypothetical protein MJT46_014791 [Ovis ammon polii x Ovis aries]